MMGLLMSISHNPLYRFLGPTTTHLHHEISLLTTLVILTAASLLSLYRSSFGLIGDYRYLLLTTLWLSRHLIHRIICTTDVGTSIHKRFSPARIWIWFFSGGHYFDSIDIHDLSSSTSPSLLLSTRCSTVSALSSTKTDARDYKGGVGFEIVGEAGGSATGVPFHRLWIFSRFLVRPIVILGASGKYVTMKLSSRRRVVRSRSRSRRRGGGSGGSGGGKGMEYFDDDFFDDDDSTIPDDERFSQIIVQLHSDLNRKLDIFWEYLPPVQLVLTIFTLLASIWFIDYASDLMTSRRGGYGGPLDSAWSRGWQMALSGSEGGYGHINDRNQGSMAPQSNAYKHSREQLGLNNDLMALRFQATRQNFAHIADKKKFLYGSPGIWCLLGIVGTISSLVVYGRVLLPLPDMVSNTCVFNPGKISGKSSKSQKVGKPWSETYKSIESEDRFHLYAKVSFLRILENLFLCAILPQTEYVCKATGHCETDIMIFELNGIPSVTGVKGQSMFDNIIQDRLSAFIIAVSVVSVTTLTLISQAATLDRSFLARKGYIDSKSSKRFVGNSWISTSLGNFRHFVNRGFANEVGPLSTSRILAVSSHIHLLQIIFIMFVLVMYTAFEKNFYALGLTFVAIVNSSGAMDIGVLEYDELQTIADEISQ